MSNEVDVDAIFLSAKERHRAWQNFGKEDGVDYKAVAEGILPGVSDALARLRQLAPKLRYSFAKGAGGKSDTFRLNTNIPLGANARKSIPKEPQSDCFYIQVRRTRSYEKPLNVAIHLGDEEGKPNKPAHLKSRLTETQALIAILESTTEYIFSGGVVSAPGRGTRRRGPSVDA